MITVWYAKDHFIRNSLMEELNLLPTIERSKQIDLMKSAESRTSGYLRNWIKNPAFRAELKKRPQTEG